MLDHVGIPVSDFARSREFYGKALAAIGYALMMEVPAEVAGKAFAGFGENGKPDFWISAGQVASGVHLAFQVQTRAQVDAFYRAALEAGGRDNGEPGLRPHYHPDYYGAFVLDPDGYNIEAVCHRPG